MSSNTRRRAIISDLSADKRRDLRSFWRAYKPLYDQTQTIIEDEARKIPAFATLMDQIPEAQRIADSAANRARIEDAILNDQWDPYCDHLRQEGIQYARMGFDFAGWSKLQSAFRDYLLGAFFSKVRNKKDLEESLAGLNAYLDIAMGLITESYLEANQQVIAQQQTAILELSTPVLQVRDRLLILPLVGVVDTLRARHLTEQLLNRIRSNRARVVVIDITGVPIVDSKVANHLVQTVEAARLMGATVIITGLSPEIAQTLVALGADLGDITTLGDLQEGLEAANRLLGYKIVRDEKLPAEH